MGSRDTLCHVGFYVNVNLITADSSSLWPPHYFPWCSLRPHMLWGSGQSHCGATRRFGFVCLPSRVFTQEDAMTCLFLRVVGLSIGMLSLILRAFPQFLPFCQAAACWASISQTQKNGFLSSSSPSCGSCQYGQPPRFVTFPLKDNKTVLKLKKIYSILKNQAQPLCLWRDPFKALYKCHFLRLPEHPGGWWGVAPSIVLRIPCGLSWAVGLLTKPPNSLQSHARFCLVLLQLRCHRRCLVVPALTAEPHLREQSSLSVAMRSYDSKWSCL